MLKRLQKRFILLSMGCFLIILLLLVVGINLVNYRSQVHFQDEQLSALLTQGSAPLQMKDREAPMDGPMEQTPAQPPEEPDTQRYFSVRLSRDGTVSSVDTEYISSVTEETAAVYARAVLEKSRKTGYYENFRFLIAADGEGTTVIFLSCERELQMMRSMLLISLCAAAAMLLLLLLPISLLSRRAVQPIVENVERQKRFITDASHEIKTPLTSISTSADVLSLKYGGDEWVENIQKQTVRLSRLVGGLVTLSRLDEQTPFADPGLFCLSDAVWEATEPFAAMAAARGCRYTQDIADGLMLYGDRTSVQQLCSILLDNAVKYAVPGGEIRFVVQKKRKHLSITVTNPCQSEVDVASLDRWFDRFYRPDDSRSGATGGTGIGLSVARAIVEAHKGRISVSLQAPHTVCFCAEFPAP